MEGLEDLSKRARYQYHLLFHAIHIELMTHNEPRYLLEVASTVAACRGVPVAALAEETTANAKRLFDLNTPITGEA